MQDDELGIYKETERTSFKPNVLLGTICICLALFLLALGRRFYENPIT